jgi:hypothetical protein
MNKSNKNTLLERFPHFFNDLHYGFCIGDGWFPILWSLCIKLESIVATYPIGAIEIVQIKEKFGTLRIYTNLRIPEDNVRDQVRIIIDEHENLSSAVCEKCGAAGKLTQDLAWIRTLCWFHHFKEILSKNYGHILSKLRKICQAI